MKEDLAHSGTKPAAGIESKLILTGEVVETEEAKVVAMGRICECI